MQTPENGEVTFVPLTARLAHVDKDSWWRPDESLDYGAGPLLYRCMREYYWSKDYALRVLRGYRQFLELKKVLEDWDAKILTPSIAVNQMWHQHLLDVTNYCHDCIVICGRVVGNDPDGPLDEWAHEKKIIATKQLLRARFEREVDIEVWRFPEAGEKGTAEVPRAAPSLCMSGLTMEERYGIDEKKKLSNSYASPSPRIRKNSNPEDLREEVETVRTAQSSTSSKRRQAVIHESKGAEREVEVENNGDFTVRVRTLKGSIYTLTVNRDMSIYDIKTMIQKQYQIPEDKQHLLFYGKVLEDRKTLGEYSIPPDSGLQLLVRSRKPLDVSAF